MAGSVWVVTDSDKNVVNVCSSHDGARLAMAAHLRERYFERGCNAKYGDFDPRHISYVFGTATYYSVEHTPHHLRVHVQEHEIVDAADVNKLIHISR